MKPASDAGGRLTRTLPGRFWEVCEWVQASVRSRAFEAGGVYVPIERHIRGFNDWVLEQLGVSVEAPDGGGLATPPV